MEFVCGSRPALAFVNPLPHSPTNHSTYPRYAGAKKKKNQRKEEKSLPKQKNKYKSLVGKSSSSASVFRPFLLPFSPAHPRRSNSAAPPCQLPPSRRCAYGILPLLSSLASPRPFFSASRSLSSFFQGIIFFAEFRQIVLPTDSPRFLHPAADSPAPTQLLANPRSRASVFGAQFGKCI